MPITQLSATHSLSPSLFIFQPYPIQLNKDLWHRWIHRMSRVKMPSIYRFSFAPRRTTFKLIHNYDKNAMMVVHFSFVQWHKELILGAAPSPQRVHTPFEWSHTYFGPFSQFVSQMDIIIWSARRLKAHIDTFPPSYLYVNIFVFMRTPLWMGMCVVYVC